MRTGECLTLLWPRESFRTCRRKIIEISELLSTKCIAARDISRFQAGREPSRTLCRSAVGEGIGHNVTLRLSLQSIIPDGGCRLQCKVHVSRFNEVSLCVASVSPDASKAIGLQLNADLQTVGLGLIHGTLRLLHLW